MSILETRGGVPLVLRETFDLDGRKVNLFGNNKWICIRVKEFPCKVYFTEEDYDADVNYIGINPPSEETPNGEWIGSTESNYLWIRGYNWSSEVELVAVKSLPDLYLGEYSAGSVLVPAATITTTKVGTFSMTLRGYPGSLTVDWGDGSAPQIVTLLGVGTSVVVNHTYVLAGSKHIVLTAPELITYVFANSQSIVSALVSFINKLKFLSYLSLNFNALSEDISAIRSVLSNLTSLNLSTCSLVGDISVLEDASAAYTNISLGQNKLTCENVFSSPAFTGSSYSFRSSISVASHVDNALISFASGGMHNTSLYLDGTNPARTSASDAAVATLLGNAVVLYVNS